MPTPEIIESDFIAGITELVGAPNPNVHSDISQSRLQMMQTSFAKVKIKPLLVSMSVVTNAQIWNLYLNEDQSFSITLNGNVVLTSKSLHQISRYWNQFCIANYSNISVFSTPAANG